VHDCTLLLHWCSERKYVPLAMQCMNTLVTWSFIAMYYSRDGNAFFMMYVHFECTKSPKIAYEAGEGEFLWNGMHTCVMIKLPI
jgi:hypothetical protein